MIPLKDNVKAASFPFINYLLIAGNLYGFYREVTQPNAAALAAFVREWSLTPARLLLFPDGAWATIYTSMFLHGGWIHLLGNMLYLWIFGNGVEGRMGHRRYLLFYLLCGTLAALSQVAVAPSSTGPMVGASGAIAGVLGAYFLLYPKAKILSVVPIWIFLRIVEIPAIFFLGFWFLIQAFQGWGSLGSGAVGGIAWAAHAGGFLAGGILVLFFKKPELRRKK